MLTKALVKHNAIIAAQSLGLLYLARALTKKSIRILGYHYVEMDDESTRFPSVFLSKETFRRRLDIISKNYTIISLESAVRQLIEDDIKPNQVVLTFDDGLYNFKHAALPILEEYSATATVYVITDYMLSQQPIFTMLIRDLLMRTKVTSIPVIDPKTPNPTKLETQGDRAALQQWAFDQMDAKRLPEDTRMDVVTLLASVLNVELDPIINARTWHSLNATEVLEIHDAGYSVQLHGHAHKNVVAKAHDAYEDIFQCKRILDNLLNTNLEHYCYPGGMWWHKTWPHLSSLNISSATTTMAGPNFAKTPLHALRRIMDGNDRSESEFALEFSFFKWILRLPLNPSLLYGPSEKTGKYKETGYAY